MSDTEKGPSSLTSTGYDPQEAASRFRLLFDAAADGIVELDARSVVVHANAAFCILVGLPFDMVIGRAWAQIAGSAVGGGTSLANLPSAGEAVLGYGDGARYLEARSSEMPTKPQGRLMIIRDVTASRVSEQTIRTLFQFLQDRDEDRTQLLHRTNAAIESERNRIARDLHDGPIQGVTGATLSLEAVRLKIGSGDIAGAAEILEHVQDELAAEADSLRRVLGDLRPPILEERGLVPAIRELCERFERQHEVQLTVTVGPYVSVPLEVETVAYRVAQEALTNVGKHAAASRVDVRVETRGSSLDIEVSDDGRGFDPEHAREFLRRGRMGIASMRERTEIGGGTLVVRSRPGAGTTVSASLPFDVLAAAPRKD
jgi:signal transduction histidine kinase